MKFIIVLVVIVAVCGGENIRQCTCAEVDKCQSSVVDGVVDCVNHCKNLALNSSVDVDKTVECIQNEQAERGACFTAVRNQICANQENVTIDVSETFKSSSNKFVEKTLQSRIQEALSDKRQEISNLITDSLGENAEEFKSCMRKCAADTDALQCVEHANCGLKRPNAFNLLSSLPACQQRRSEAKQRICQCIKNTGATKIS
uniref:Uncharacterized protein n=1 Tax=Panagrolaimus sp. JU765 TaxID=591449 RepID=A0AC34RQL3_9BILA